MFKIRNAEKKDLPKILALLIQVDMVHHNGRPDLFRGPATKYSAEELEKIIIDPQRPVFVCENEDGEVLGHAFCVIETPREQRVLRSVKTLYIDDICVDEAARRQGVGTALFSHVTAFAKSVDCYHITLSVWACNPEACAFYEKMGMQVQRTYMESIL